MVRIGRVTIRADAAIARFCLQSVVEQGKPVLARFDSEALVYDAKRGYAVVGVVYVRTPNAPDPHPS